MEDIGTLIIHIEVRTYIKVVHGCSVGDTNFSGGHEGGGSIELHGVGGDVTVIGNLLEVRSDIFQKGTITYEPGGVDIPCDVKNVGPRVFHVQVGTHVEVVHRCRIGDTDTIL